MSSRVESSATDHRLATTRRAPADKKARVKVDPASKFRFGPRLDWHALSTANSQPPSGRAYTSCRFNTPSSSGVPSPGVSASEAEKPLSNCVSTSP